MNTRPDRSTLIYGVLKTRKPFDVNWAKAAVETVALQPPKNSGLALDFQDGICPRSAR